MRCHLPLGPNGFVVVSIGGTVSGAEGVGSSSSPGMKGGNIGSVLGGA